MLIAYIFSKDVCNRLLVSAVERQRAVARHGVGFGSDVGFDSKQMGLVLRGKA